MSHSISMFPLFARALHKQSLWCAFKLCAARMLKKDVHIRSRYANVPVRLRARSHDFEVFHSIHNANEYPVVQDSGVVLVIDAGAHAGIGSLRFSHMFPGAKIISIEPDANNYKALLENTCTVAQIEPRHAAVWFRQTKVSISNPNDMDWSFQVSETAGAQVDAITLTDLIPENTVGKVFVKIDIEGAEAQVMLNNTEWLRRIDYLLIEIHDCYAQVFEGLVGLKYTCRISGEYLFFTFKR
jgi:FkbM family methyltransferase